jgi:hypothetical protein
MFVASEDDIRLGHCEAGSDFAFQQRLEPALLLLGRGEHVQQFHVSGVWCGTIKYLWRPWQLAHDFGKRRKFEIRQAGARLVFSQMRQKQVPKPFGLRQGLQVAHEADGVSVSRSFLHPLCVARQDMILEKRGQSGNKGLRLLRMGEIHNKLLRFKRGGPAG